WVSYVHGHSWHRASVGHYIWSAPPPVRQSIRYYNFLRISTFGLSLSSTCPLFLSSGGQAVRPPAFSGAPDVAWWSVGYPMLLVPAPVLALVREPPAARPPVHCLRQP